MFIKISNEHLNSDDIDLQFTQPKYYFGQLLTYGKDEFGKDQSGVVIQMKFTSEWRYALLNLETVGVTDWYLEDSLIPMNIHSPEPV